MKLKMFTVHDSKAEAFITPFFATTAAVAERNFQTGANTPEHPFHEHPGDYTLFEIGEFEIETGKIKVSKTMKNLGLAIVFQRPDLQAATARTMQELRDANEFRSPDNFEQLKKDVHDGRSTPTSRAHKELIQGAK